MLTLIEGTFYIKKGKQPCEKCRETTVGCNCLMMVAPAQSPGVPTFIKEMHIKHYDMELIVY